MLQSQTIAQDLSFDAIDAINDKAMMLLNVDIRQTIELAEMALQQSERPSLAEPYIEGKARALLALGAAYYRRNEHELAIEYSQQGIEICDFIQDLRSLSFGLNTIGATSITLGNYDQALNTHLRSLKIRQSIADEHGCATSLMNVGNVYYLLGEFALALDYYLQSLDLRQKIHDETGIGTSLTNIANVYGSMGDYDSALEYLLKSAEIKEQTDNKQGLGQTLVDIANEYLRRGMATIAIEYARRSYELSVSIGNKAAQAAALHAVAAIEESSAQNEHALNTYRRSYELRRSIAYHKGEVESLIAMGRLMCRVGDAEESDGVLRDALALAEEIKSRPLLFEACGALATSCEMRGQSKDALRYYKRFHQIKEELFNEESARKTRNLETLHKVEQARQEAEIYRLRSVELGAANQEILRQQNVLSHQAEELHQQNNELQALVHEKNELLAIVAHDLKNPLSGIVISTSNLQRNHHRMSADETATQLGIIERTAKRMKQIVLNLLDLHAIESNKVTISIENLNLCDYVQQVIERYHPRAEEKHIALRLVVEHISMTVRADANALLQILENIISNAVKFSAAHSEVLVHCYDRNGTVVCEVHDSGPGIRPDEQHKLFEKFSKISNQPTAGEESTGLGLSIVLRLCQAMHLKIEHRNLKPRGSCFTLLFPIRSSH